MNRVEALTGKTLTFAQIDILHTAEVIISFLCSFLFFPFPPFLSFPFPSFPFLFLSFLFILHCFLFISFLFFCFVFFPFLFFPFSFSQPFFTPPPPLPTPFLVGKGLRDPWPFCLCFTLCCFEGSLLSSLHLLSP